MKPKPVSPMLIFVRELRKKGWVPDQTLKRIMAPILEKDGSLQELQKSLLENGSLQLGQISQLNMMVKNYFDASTSAVISPNTHPEEVLESLNERISGEIKEAKSQEWEKMQQIQQKMQSSDSSPMKIMVREIRKQSWCPDDQLKKVLSDILERGGTPKDFIDRLAFLKLINPYQIRYLYEHTSLQIQEEKKSTRPVVKDELSELEKSLGGEVKIETKGEGPPLHISQLNTKSPPPTTQYKPHTKRVRILSDEEDAFGFFNQEDGKDDDQEKNLLF